MVDDTYSYEVRFGRRKPIQFISHLDLMRVWERMFRRARLPVAHSHGFNPRPLLTFAAPLPVGVLSRNDLLEVVLQEPVPAEELLPALRAQAVPGLTVEGVTIVAGRRKSLPARMREALYEIELWDADPEGVRQAVEALMAAPSVPMHMERGGRIREYDLRPLVLDLDQTEGSGLRARLRHDPQATGRPDDLLRALGHDPAQAQITRTGLVLAPVDGG